MAGSNALTIAVGADTSKLRADLALAQADLTAFGKELKAAATEARETGDYSKVQELSDRYEDARKSVIGLNQEIKNDTAVPVIEFDFAKARMGIPIHQCSRRE